MLNARMPVRLYTIFWQASPSYPDMRPAIPDLQTQSPRSSHMPLPEHCIPASPTAQDKPHVLPKKPAVQLQDPSSRHTPRPIHGFRAPPEHSIWHAGPLKPEKQEQFPLLPHSPLPLHATPNTVGQVMLQSIPWLQYQDLKNGLWLKCSRSERGNCSTLNAWEQEQFAGSSASRGLALMS